MQGPPRRSVFVALTALASVALAPVVASAQIAQVPRCSGSDAAAQARARAEGLRRYRAAVARNPVNRVEMAAALEAFETQCRAGDVNALEMRAYALAALGRHVEAAESLDSFLEARPLQTLDADTRARVGSQRGAILAEVATLTLEGAVNDSNVMVNGRGYGALPQQTIRLAPGEVTVQVFAPSIGAVRRQFTMGPGETRRESFEPGRATVASNTTSGTNASTTAASTNNSNASATSAITTASNNEPERPPPVDTGEGPARTASRGAPVVPIVLGVSGLAVGGGFVGALLWHNSRLAELAKPECTNPTDPEIVNACNAVRGERDAAFATEITTAVVGGGLLVGAGVTLGLWFASAPRTSARSAAFCAPSIGASTGLSCGARF